MKQKLLSAALMAAAMLMGTINASAADEATTVYERGTTTAWSNTDLTDRSTPPTGTLSIESGLKYESVNNKANSVSTKSISVTENSIITFNAVWAVGNATGQKGTSGSATCSVLSLGDLKFYYYGQNKVAYVQIGTDTKTELSGMGDRGATWKINATINQATGAISYSIESDKAKSKVTGTTTNANGSYSTLTFGQGGKSGGWSNTTTLTSIDISEEKQSVSSASYTLKFVSGTTTLKDNVTGTGIVGQTVTLDASYKDPITTSDGTRYIYTSDDASTQTIAADGSTVITLNFHKAATATLNVNYKINGTDSVVSKTLSEGDDGSLDYTYVYPYYLKGKDGKYYKVDESTSFGGSGTFTDGETISKTVTYSTADDEVVFYGEAEEETGSDTNYSNGAAGHVAAQNKTNRGYSLGTLESGSYQVVVKVTDNPARQLAVRDASSEDATANQLAITDGNSIGEQTLNFTLEEAKTLLLNGKTVSTVKSNQSADFDYVIVKRLGDATMTATINSNNLASFSSTHAVTVPDDVSIYIAAAPSDDTITLTKVSGKVVPANTGVILYSATTGDKTLTIGGTTTDDFSANKLIAATSDVTAGANCYALLKTSQSFAKVTEGTTIPAGKAYIESSSSSAKLNITRSTTTNISDIKANIDNENAPVYNLAGQRVSKSYRGVVIKNGKKYIVK